MQVKLFAAATLAAALAAPGLAAAKPLTICTESSPDGFDVVQYNSLVTTNASADVIFNTLVSYDEAAKKVVPALADKWDASADGLTYTFHLRPNVAFQTTEYFKPTHALDADDVVFTFSRMLDDANPWHKVAGASGFPHAQSMGLVKLVKSVTKVDDSTVKFVLNEANATFVPILTMGFASIYSAEYADQLLKAGKQADLNAKPVGTGPFVLKSYTKDALIRYDVNPTYWGTKPKVDRLIYAITPDPSVRLQKVKAGECQIALSPKPQDVLAAKGDNALKVVQTPAFMTAFVALNTQKKPLDNDKVREALNLAFDRATYLKVVFDNTATAANNPYPPNTWSYAKDVAPYAYDPAKAKQLLAQAGFPNGFDLTLWAMPVQRPYNPNAQLMAQLIQQDWAKIGVRAKIVSYEWGEYNRRAKHDGQHDAILYGWSGDNGDPDNWLGTLLGCDAVHGSNLAKWCNQDFEKLVDAARSNGDVAKRTALYEQAQVVFKDQVPFTPIATSIVSLPVSRRVHGLTFSPLGGHRFDGVWLD